MSVIVASVTPGTLSEDIIEPIDRSIVNAGTDRNSSERLDWASFFLIRPGRNDTPCRFLSGKLEEYCLFSEIERRMADGSRPVTGPFTRFGRVSTRLVGVVSV